MPRLHLRTKLLLLSLLVALIPIGIAGRTLIGITRDELKAFANEGVVLTAGQIAGEIDATLETAWAPALNMLRDTLEARSLGDREKSAVLQASRDIPDLVALQITTGAAPVLVLQEAFSERLRAAGLDPTDTLKLPAEQVAALRRDQGMAHAAPRHVAKTDDWLLTIVLPLDPEAVAPDAAMAATFDLRRTRQRIEEHGFAAKGRITLVDETGHRLFDPQATDLSQLELVRAAREGGAEGARAAAAVPVTDADGNLVLGGFAPSRFLGWIVLVDLPEATAYRAVHQMTRSLIFWVALGSLAAAAAAFVFASRMSGPILEIGRVAREVGRGNFDVRVAAAGSGDEIAELGGRMNEMIAGLVERERVKSENEMLRDMTEKLRALNEQKNRFLGMAAHDLRNPISGILGYSEMLLEGELAEEDRTVVGKIESSSTFMLRLLNDLLDISQIESGRLDLSLEPTDLAALVTQNVELNRIIASKKDIHIDLAIPDDLPQLSLDAGKIEQVLSNLVSNAIKYSFPKTVVSVELRRLDSEIEIRVRDQGQGIPPDELHKVFQEFQKTSVKSTAGERSTGLGLAIVKKVVDGHGGRIGVESEVGRGSTFYVTLPLPTAEGDRGGRRDERVSADVAIQFAVSGGETSVAGAGTALDLSSSGTLLDASVPLHVGDTIRFSLRLPEGPVTGSGKLVRQVSSSRFGVLFSKLDADGQERIQAFIASRA